MASGASAPRPLPRCYRAQPAVPLAGVWRLGATDDAHAADREYGVLPALPPESRGGGGAWARPASHLPLPILYVVGRQAIVRRPCRLGSRSPTSMFTSRNTRGADSMGPSPGGATSIAAGSCWH